MVLDPLVNIETGGLNSWKECAALFRKEMNLPACPLVFTASSVELLELLELLESRCKSRIAEPFELPTKVQGWVRLAELRTEDR